VISPTSAWDVHFVPLGRYLRVWLVDPETDEVHAYRSLDAGAPFRGGVADQVVRTSRNASDGDGWQLDDGTLNELRKQTAELFSDPFDQELRNQLRRPLTLWLNQRLQNVEARKEDQYNRTQWEVTIAPPMEADHHFSFVEEYPTVDIIARYPTGFGKDYYELFHDRIPVNNTRWFVWHALGCRWLGPNAIVRSYSETDMPDIAPEDVRFRRAPSGVLHLCDADSGEPLCEYSLSESIDEHPFEFDELPAATALCTACTEAVKRCIVAATVRGYNR
jgi:hypothetical protein